MAMCLHSCYDDTALWEEVNDHSARLAKLETLCNQMNTDISTLKSLVSTIQKGGYITDVIPLTENGVEVGYKITLSDGKIISIRHGNKGDKGDTGDQGRTPEIAVKMDTDGKYYWVVDGTWLLDGAGNKVQVAPEEAEDGITPIVKIENGMWCVSYNNGTTWDELGPAVAENTCIFKDAKYENGVLTLYFDDENMLPLPVGSAFKIVLGEYDINGREMTIPYTIQGAAGEVMVFAMASVEHYNEPIIWVREVIEESAYSGKIIVRSYWEEKEYNGKLAIFAVNEAGTTVSKIIRVESAVVKELDDDKYVFGSEATQFDIKLSTNRDWEAKIDADWVSYVKTKAIQEKSFLFDVQENTSGYRKTNIHLTSGDMTITIPVYQKAGDGSIFYVTKKAHVYEYRDLNVYLDGNYDNILVNKFGEKLHEVLGYDTWDELARAIGPWEKVEDLAGDVIIRAYNPFSGEPYEPTDYYSYYYYGNVPSFKFGAEGEIDRYDSYVEFSWHFDYNEEGDDLLYPYFSCDLDTKKDVNGKSFTFGILLSSDDAEARIEVTIDVENFVDPEAGQYTNPQPAGSYEFDIKDEIELDIPYVLGQSSSSYNNESIFEKIKQTIGMTSYELWKTFDSWNNNLLLPDETPGNYYYINLRFDSEGNKTTSTNYALRVYSNSGISAKSTHKVLEYSIPTQSVEGVRNWKQPVLDAVENGTVFKYKYIFDCNDDKLGTYKFIFNVETKIKKKESSL